MNEPKAARYHRLDRRIACAATAVMAVLFALLLATGWSVRIRELSGGSAAGYVLVLGLLLQAFTLPAAWYRGVWIERQFGLSRVTTRFWAQDHATWAGLTLLGAGAAAEVLYGAIRLFPEWWWIAAAGAGVLSIALLTFIAPVLVLPLFERSRPLSRAALHERLNDLARRAGVNVVGVHEWNAGAETRRATATLVGAGATRRILLSPGLLAEYSDDEIEVVLAHEMGHHVHRDLSQALLLQGVVLLAGCRAAAAVLDACWRPLGLASAGDVAGLPLVGLVVGTVLLLAAPGLNALSRAQERRADMFALSLASRPDAFAGVVRRMAAQNLAEERPSRAALWLFHTHPPIEERIRRAREKSDANGCGC